MGSHTVVATHTGAAGTEVYFDFLELAVPSADLPVVASQPVVTLATDWDTLHCISLPPERTAWMLTSLNFAGRANHYVGALWFYELVRVGHVYASATVTFSGTPAPNAYVTVTLGQAGQPPSSDTVLQKQIHVADTADTIALAFAQELNRGYTGVWASAMGSVLTITARTMGLAGDANTVAASTTSGGFTATVVWLQLHGRRGRQLADGPDGEPGAQSRGAGLERGVLCGAGELWDRHGRVVQHGIGEWRSVGERGNRADGSGGRSDPAADAIAPD